MWYPRLLRCNGSHRNVFAASVPHVMQQKNTHQPTCSSQHHHTYEQYACSNRRAEGSKVYSSTAAADPSSDAGWFADSAAGGCCSSTVAITSAVQMQLSGLQQHAGGIRAGECVWEGPLFCLQNSLLLLCCLPEGSVAGSQACVCTIKTAAARTVKTEAMVWRSVLHVDSRNIFIA